LILGMKLFAMIVVASLSIKLVYANAATC
jgi:hypothetical protein